ncbi:MAG: SDR family NAD(P)-dependent oxidoreductase [Clostridia bacterium]|nr:SDR family NAD(P)-dependent oxidoreductase [Clostridia bacterium]
MKTVLITGASRGIGAETAVKFAKQGYTVFINYNRSQQQAEQLKQQLNEMGLDAHLLKADVSNEQQVKQMFDYVKRYAKKLDVLVLNAGVGLHQQVQDVSIQQYDSVMDVNAKGAFLCAKYAVPLMLDKFAGSIVAVSSIWGLQGASCESVYSMSKFALVGLAMSLHAKRHLPTFSSQCSSKIRFASLTIGAQRRL